MSENVPSSSDGAFGSASSAPRYDAPSWNAAGGPTGAPVPPKKKGIGKWIAGGCGCAVLLVLLIGGCSVIAGLAGSGDDDSAPVSETTNAQTETAAPVPSSAAPAAPATSEAPAAPATTEAPAAPAEDVPAEYTAALGKAETYSEYMHMSKAGIYDQLVSEYGEKFSPEAAQYAVDNVKADWNANALAKAKIYQNEMNMSPPAVHDQLTSEYGEKFTEEEADYAIEHLND